MPENLVIISSVEDKETEEGNIYLSWRTKKHFLFVMLNAPRFFLKMIILVDQYAYFFLCVTCCVCNIGMVQITALSAKGR